MDEQQGEAGWLIQRLTLAYHRLLIAGFALTPLIAIAYVYSFQDPALRFEHHLFHEVAIGIAIALSAFATYVTWRCYRASGEVFLRWLALGFLGFTVIYLPHGFLTRIVDEGLALFLIFGPASRLVMAACFFIALLRYRALPDVLPVRCRYQFWLAGLGVFLLIMAIAAYLGRLPWEHARPVLVGLETGAMLLSLAGILVMAVLRTRSPLMTVYMVSLAVFAQASLAFLLATPWNHLWWLGHGIFAAGFFMLSYGIVQAFHTTRSFSTVYSQMDMMAQLREQQAWTQEALLQVQEANRKLEQLASTDALTGVANRRQLVERADMEVPRSERHGAPLSLLCLDLDHFKRINDDYGHLAGDEVLKQVAEAIQLSLRPSDLLARVGGEEFHVLLPDTDLAGARDVAERIRVKLEGLDIPVQGVVLHVTVSVGCAQLGPDGADMKSLTHTADERLYQAKALGRNRVVIA